MHDEPDNVKAAVAALIVFLVLSLLAIGAYCLLSGCASLAPRQTVTGVGVAPRSPSTPAPAPAISSADNEQVTGGVAAALVKLQAAVEANGLKYTSQFGVGAVLVCLVLAAVAIVSVSLAFQSLKWSHARAVERIKKGLPNA